MPSPLLTASALFVIAESPTTPVDTQRVTGNVSTQHSATPTPLIDSCRVTGNISFSPATKGGRGRRLCVLHTATATAPLLDSRHIDFAVENRACSVDGTLAETPHGTQCHIQGALEVSWPEKDVVTLLPKAR